MALSVKNECLADDAANQHHSVGGKARRTQLPSGIIQMGLRSYVPSLGRFLTPDPVQGGSANAYDYADQDPVNSFDLTGECSRRSRSCARRNAAKLNHRSRRTARSHGLQRLARRGGSARASISLPSPSLAFRPGKDVAGKVGSTAGGLASAAFKFVRQAAEKSPQFVTAREIVTRAMAGMKAAYSWAADHQEQIYSCMYGAAEGFIYNRYLLIGGEAGAGALGLYMAVKCGVAFVG